MDQNENANVNPSSSLFQMNLDAQNSYNLRSAASWSKVLGVVGIILGAIFIILCVITLSKISGYESDYGYRRSSGGFDDVFGGSTAATKTGLWILILTGVIFILGGAFSFNFGNKIGQALRSNDQQALNGGFAALRNYYAVRSITLIIVLLLFLISFANAV